MVASVEMAKRQDCAGGQSRPAGGRRSYADVRRPTPYSIVRGILSAPAAGQRRRPRMRAQPRHRADAEAGPIASGTNA